MIRFETIIANSWNRLLLLGRKKLTEGLDLGRIVQNGKVGKQHYFIPHNKRPEHMTVLGKTGSGKTHLLLRMCLQDIRAGRGFLFFEQHGDTVPVLLSAIAAEEKRSGEDLSGKVVLIDPTDPKWSPGINVLATADRRSSFVEVASLAHILKDRWGMGSFGAQTEELLRNSLYVLSVSDWTLVELPLLLTDPDFRQRCIKRVDNPDIKEYFELRFDPVSEALKAVRRDPVLNKVSEFISDPHFKHLLGQVQSTIRPLSLLDQGSWVIVNLSKGRLGPHSSTLGSLILALFKSAIFLRQSRQLFTLYCDEIQNLVASESGIDILFAEARKFGVSVVSANQFLAQFPKDMRSAMQAVGSHIFFQLSLEDAEHAAQMLDGGHPLAERIRNLPKRNCVAKNGHYAWQQVEIPHYELPDTPFADLLRRSRERFARPREVIEQEIRSRRATTLAARRESLDAWE